MMAGEGAAPVDPMEMILAQYDDGVASGELPPLLEMGAGVKALSMSIDVPGGDMFAFMGATNDANSAAYAVENMGIRIVADFVDAESCEQVTAFFSDLMTESAPRNNEFQPLAMTLENGGAWGTDAITVWSYEPTAEDQYEWTAMERSTKLMSGGRAWPSPWGTSRARSSPGCSRPASRTRALLSCSPRAGRRSTPPRARPPSRCTSTPSSSRC